MNDLILYISMIGGLTFLIYMGIQGMDLLYQKITHKKSIVKEL